ncbi:MAG: rhomboid family intramembrane serine protease [Actinobacteria bacterium]|nr:rhomboid family intramembrane serine protease [Actinomycetota bacterium]NIS32797.1 rhomboid family intramembrane serine protease [Actinomycetota bacterium]NIT96459.1 rhomboid family intramembrane serine protease [Actinomycetota bacterium]NIU20156.1 rhomboid family intramembrane serine protease [Actinomycetota bacterium]NIU67775.1 rhomboid family intramembrane serine protease [Actinomycetota bacterium]
MHQASVGFHCPECVRDGGQKVYKGPPTFDPVVTKALIGINVAVWLYGAVSGGRTSRIGRELLVDGGLFGPLVADGEWYRLVTSGFLHDGIAHLLFNMYALWILGGQLERILNRARYVALYAASLLGGALGVLLLDPTALTVGASGAVFGLFGAVAVIQRSAGFSIWASGLGPVLALNLFITFAIPRISIGGHIGGLVAGAIVAAMVVQMTRARRGQWEMVGAVVALAAVFVAAALWVAANPIV